MNTQPSICIMTSLYPPVFSGSSIHCADLARNLARRGCRVTVITSRVSPESPEFEAAEGMEVHRLPCVRLPRLNIALNFPWLNWSLSPENVRRTLAILRERPPDILHLHNHMFDSSLLAVTAARRLGIPLALTVHTIIKHTRPAYDFLLQMADRYLLKLLVVQHVDAAICQDAIVVKYVKETFGYSNPALIPYGISPMRIPDPEKIEALRNKYALGTGPVILSIGHLHDTRDRRELIQILPRLLGVFPKLKLLIVGYVGVNSARKLAASLGVEQSVIFTGAVPHADIPEFLALADVEAHWFTRSHPHKTPGIAGQETMRAGRVLATNANEDVYGKGVLKDGENVVLIDPFDADSLFDRLSDILSDAGRRERIGRNAARTAEQYFGWDAVCGRMLDVYASMQRSKP